MNAFPSPPRPVARRVALGLAAAALAAPAVRAQPAAQLLAGSDGWLFRAHEPQLGLSHAGLNAVSALIGQAVTMLDRAGVKVFLSVSPLRSRIYRDRLPPRVRLSAETEGRLAAGLRALRGTGAPVVDVSAAFLKRRAGPGAPLLFYRRDNHWSPDGAELAAATMAAQIVQRAGLPPATRPGTRLGPPTRIQHYGDLLLLVPEAERRALGYEEVNRRSPVPAQAGGLLADDTPADVVAVGSSYLHPDFGYAACLSEALGRPVDLTWAVHPTGPYRTLLRCVTGESFRRKRPAVLVWHLLEDDLDVEPTRNDLWRGNTMTGAAFVTDLRRALGV